MSFVYQWLIGEICAAKDMHRQNGRCFPFAVVVSVCRGRYICSCCGKKYVAQAGETLFVPPFVPHGIRMDEPGVLSWAHFSAGNGARRLFAGMQTPAIITGEPSKRIKAFAEALAEIQSDQTDYGITLRDSCIAGISAQMISLFGLAQPIGEQEQWKQKVEKLIRVHITDGIRIRWLAEECGLSESGFSHRFRRTFGRSPGSYILNEKIKEAVLLLSEGMTVGAVSEALHFSDESHFSKQFSRHVGSSPGAFRRILQNSNP